MDVGLVCDACSALTPIGVPQCARCGQPVALDPRQKRASVQPPQAGTNGTAQTNTPPAITNPGTAVGTDCGKCGSMIPPNFKFCPSCGNKVSPSAAARGQQDFEVQTRVGPRTADPSVQKPGRSTLFFGGAMQAARAKLTLIRGDGEDGVSFTLAGTDHLAGRGDCPISFPDDTFLSPMHANFRYSNNQLVVRDEGSLNGVFVRISGTVQITAGTTILVGEQVLTITPAPVADDVPDAEGTYYSASMIRHATMEIAQQLRGGTPGWVFRVDTEAVSIGRENNDINFPDDPFISGRHAQIQLVQGMLSVTDLGSRNGTFVRVSGEHVLKHGDYVFLGQQLLRVEIV
jgi:pSer/pThr/pTyr-binding forkhead associated (FHA) protein/RNA polymerase subunit RPABC4/transcription elongation factor Spt4